MLGAIAISGTKFVSHNTFRSELVEVLSWAGSSPPAPFPKGFQNCLAPYRNRVGALPPLRPPPTHRPPDRRPAPSREAFASEE